MLQFVSLGSKLALKIMQIAIQCLSPPPFFSAMSRQLQQCIIIYLYLVYAIFLLLLYQIEVCGIDNHIYMKLWG